ncbi:hypothetical protein HY950_01545 [Candidatus Gottesmanbacteria bacterium]|nr:hypothetical protein [Candidatus Gottesmanbacteria bacterium]
MQATEAKKHLSFGSLIKYLGGLYLDVPDWRQEGKVEHSIRDTAMGGVGMMYFQSDSVLEFQRQLEVSTRRSNLSTLFGVNKVPSDSQMREILDEVSSETARPAFKKYFAGLQRGKYLERFQIFPGQYLLSLDGSQYFGSENISCPHCLIKEHKSGQTNYSHLILQATLVHPDQKQVIPLMPEEICNEDGTTKQDCEFNAAKRILPQIRTEHPFLDIIINCDGLYSKQPMFELLYELKMHGILVAKEDDHKPLFEWVSEQRQLGETTQYEAVDEKHRKHRYEWINAVPLNGRPDSILVNFFRYQIIVDGEVTYKSAWVTDLEVTKQNVATMVRAGRARWKIENECFNTLKNQGYHLEHNFGHGQKNLSFNFFLFNLLAFFIHQILELTDGMYQRCRQCYRTKKHLWETLRVLFGLFIFETWENMLTMALSRYTEQPRPG